MPTTIHGEEYVIAREAASYLQVSAQTFLKFQKMYHLKAVMRPGLGNRKFFRKKDLDPIFEYRPVEDKREESTNTSIEG